MSKATDVAKGLNTKIQIVRLAAGTRTRTQYTITTSSMASMGATSIAVTSLPTALSKGDALTFGSVTVTLTADAALAATSISVAATSGMIASGATATTYAMKNLSGADNTDLMFQGKTVDVSTFGDGLFTENAKVQVDASIKLSGVTEDANAAYQIMLALANTPDELYFIITDEKGYTTEGVAVVESFDIKDTYRDVRKWSASLKVNQKAINKDATNAEII